MTADEFMRRFLLHLLPPGFNINRQYPMTMPTFKLHRGSHITVCVFHPLPFETLTLDAGAASAYESSDQASALVTSVLTYGKGAAFGTT